jgi:hypothetical protein
MKHIFTLLFFLFGYTATIHASSGGITGRSLIGCGGGCHGSQNAATSVSLREGAGPFTVQAGAAKSFTAVVAHASLTKAGMNLSVKNSSNTNVGTYSATNNCSSSGGELIQTSPVNMSGGEAEFAFTWTAPSTPGTYTMRMAGNAVNGNGGTSGDMWNLMNEVTIIVEASGTSISLTSQSSASTVCRNAPVNITWTGSGLSGNTAIEMSPTGGAPWTQIGSVPASTLNYTWNIPPNQTYSGNYRIRVINGTAIDTIDAPISILPIPVITSNPTPLDTACIGTSKTLSIGVQSDENFLTFQWSRNNTPIPGATSKTYTINSINANSAGSYTCSVNGCSQVISTIAQLVVAEQTAIITQPVAINGCKNTTAQLSIAANGMNLIYQWNKNGNPIPNSNRASFSFSSLQTDDAGTYTCIVTGYCGTPITSASAIVSIIPSPVATLSFSNDTAICAGKEFRIKASGTGGTITSYVWKKNGTTLTTTDSVLVIPSLALVDAGMYSVAVRNSCNELSPDKSIMLAINELPSFLRQPRDTMAVEGTLAFLRVIASGSDLRYQWRKNGVNRNGDTNAILTISTASLSDSGTYDCVISNSCQTVNSTPAKLSINKAASGPRIVLTQQSIDFGCIDKGTIDTKTIQGLIKNEGESDLIITGMQISGSQSSQFAIVGLTTLTLTPGQSKDITVSFTASDNISNTADITIKSNSTTGDKVLPLIAKSCFERIDTTAFTFGKLSAGMQKKDTTLQICNTGSKSAEITGITIVGSDKFSLKNPPTFPLTLASGECRTIEVSFNADQSGTYTAGLQVLSGKGTYTIPLSTEILSSVNDSDISSLSIMPNPAQSVISINGIMSAGIESISMISLMGREVFTQQGPFTHEKFDYSLNDVPSGVYMLRMQSRDGKHLMRQVIKQD